MHFQSWHEKWDEQSQGKRNIISVPSGQRQRLSTDRERARDLRRGYKVNNSLAIQSLVCSVLFCSAVFSVSSLESSNNIHDIKTMFEHVISELLASVSFSLFLTTMLFAYTYNVCTYICCIMYVYI
jgi:ABC-type Fe3+ transport system permease subunit